MVCLSFHIYPNTSVSKRSTRLARWRESVGIELQGEMQQADLALAIAVQEPEIARAAKAHGQHVLENHSEEIGTASERFSTSSVFALR